MGGRRFLPFLLVFWLFFICGIPMSMGWRGWWRDMFVDKFVDFTFFGLLFSEFCYLDA